MRQIDFSATAIVPIEATDEQIEAWIKYNLRATGSLEGDNPLAWEDLDCTNVNIERY